MPTITIVNNSADVIRCALFRKPTLRPGLASVAWRVVAPPPNGGQAVVQIPAEYSVFANYSFDPVERKDPRAGNRTNILSFTEYRARFQVTTVVSPDGQVQAATMTQSFGGLVTQVVRIENHFSHGVWAHITKDGVDVFAPQVMWPRAVLMEDLRAPFYAAVVAQFACTGSRLVEAETSLTEMPVWDGGTLTVTGSMWDGYAMHGDGAAELHAWRPATSNRGVRRTAPAVTAPRVTRRASPPSPPAGKGNPASQGANVRDWRGRKPTPPAGRNLRVTPAGRGSARDHQSAGTVSGDAGQHRHDGATPRADSQAGRVPGTAAASADALVTSTSSTSILDSAAPGNRNSKPARRNPRLPPARQGSTRDRQSAGTAARNTAPAAPGTTSNAGTSNSDAPDNRKSKTHGSDTGAARNNTSTHD